MASKVYKPVLDTSHRLSKPAHAAANTKRFRIDDLPLELRLEIYRHALSVNLETSIATFARPIAIPALYDWIESPLVSATKLQLLPQRFPEVGTMTPRSLVHKSSILYVDSPDSDWMLLAEEDGFANVMLNTSSWSQKVIHVYLMTLFKLWHAGMGDQLTVMILAKDSEWAQGKQLWATMRVDADGKTDCVHAHLRGRWVTHDVMEVSSSKEVDRKDWISGLLI